MIDLYYYNLLIFKILWYIPGILHRKIVAVEKQRPYPLDWDSPTAICAKKKIWNEYEEKLGYKCDYILEVDTTEDY